LQDDLVGSPLSGVTLAPDASDFVIGEWTDEPAAARFVGGIRYRGFRATWPLVELVIDEGTARVRLRTALLRRLFRPWLPALEIRLSETRIAPISGGLPLPRNEGVRLSASDEGADVVFWCFRQAQVIEALVEEGARVGEPEIVW
jgi:hypothetical protein